MNALEPEYVASMGDGTIPLNEPMFRINPLFLALDQRGQLYDQQPGHTV